MNKQELEARIKVVTETVEAHKHYVQKGKAELTELEAELAALNNPPITGRPFMKGVNEPEEGQLVWYHAVLGKQTEQCVNFEAAESNWQMDMLRRGELYPTEQDCREGNRRDEIRKRYEAMGRPYKTGEPNYRVVSYLKPTYNPYRIYRCTSFEKDNYRGEATYFDNGDDGQSAISAINAEYGAGSFEWACLGVKSNG